ncbi:MAG: hypothetical protein P1V19_15265, partial [Gimesia sp.]|nr:hypothetical protein [Gimesia sp.]
NCDFSHPLGTEESKYARVDPLNQGLPEALKMQILGLVPGHAEVDSLQEMLRPEASTQLIE